MTSFRNDGPDLDPPWLQGDVGGAILASVRAVLDALSDRCREGVKARYPSIAPPDALGHIGNDRDIERGPDQTDAGYRLQLIGAVDAWRRAGSAYAILTQLRAYFAPSNGPAMRTVSNGSVWHSINPSTGVVTRTVMQSPNNWIWDGLMTWYRGWIIIDATGLWTQTVWGGGTWGSGTWGSSMTDLEARRIKSIARKWCPANVRSTLILVFDSGLYEVTDPLSANVNGTGEDPAWRITQYAAFSDEVWP